MGRAGCDNARGAGSPAPKAGEALLVAGRGLLRTVIVLAAAAGAAAFALRKLGIIGADHPDSAIDYASDSSVNDGEDEAANE